MFFPIYIYISMIKFNYKLSTIRNEQQPLAGAAQWTECQPANQRVTGLIPSQGTYLG